YQKLDLISSLVTRACRICSSDEILNKAIQHIKNVLNCNGYPKQIIERKIKKCYMQRKTKQQDHNNNNINPTSDNKEDKK
ncbi:unnamed protein product, partial [Rotaria sp. Silwood2]